ncbi:hypothetical protein P3342_010631 [Pyrenophora teres f. teres]|nr:hypothetical protein P3342_010631 [Pyrenophora teres f. teres]
MYIFDFLLDHRCHREPMRLQIWDVRVSDQPNMYLVKPTSNTNDILHASSNQTPILWLFICQKRSGDLRFPLGILENEFGTSNLRRRI